jgi:hypothetical protein
MSNQLVAEAATYTIHNKRAFSGIRTRDTSNGAAEGLLLDSTATRIGL